MNIVFYYVPMEIIHSSITSLQMLVTWLKWRIYSSVN